MTTFKRNQRKYVTKSYRVRNWREYEVGLRVRGSLNVWISIADGKLANWDAPRPISSVRADAAYDASGVYEAVEEHSEHRSPRVLMPPIKGAKN